MKKTILTTLAAGLLSLGLASQSALANGGGEIVSVDKNFASPILTLSGYKKVFLQELDLSHTKIISPPWIDKESFHWEVKEQNLVFLKEHFQKNVAAGLTENNSRYSLAEKPGKGVLVVDVEIISFMPYALKEDTDANTKGSGEFHLSVQLRDGKSKSLIHIFEGTQTIGTNYQPNTDMSRVANSDQLFTAWGKRLREILDEAK